jgi:hypothetical protein
MVFVIQLLFGFKLNNFTVNIPIFIMAIGIANIAGIQIIDSMKANKVPVAIASPKVFIGAMLET